MTNETPEKDKVFNRYYRVFVLPLVFVVFTIISYVINPFSKYWQVLWEMSTGRRLLDMLVTLIICWLITEFSLASSRWLDKRLPWERQPVKRIVAQIICLLIGMFIFFKVLDKVLTAVFPQTEVCCEPNELDQWQFVFVCTIMAVLISAVHTGNYFLRRWKKSMLETAELQLHAAALKETAMQAQLQSLKLQLDPHFLFNSFSTLSVLIEEDQQLAQSFLENLSRVYRYMITNLNNDIVTLQQELNFIQAYIFLIRIRHGDNVRVEIEVAEKDRSRGIPPITLQLLIENAIKHNIASEQQPLRIRICDDATGNLVVRNNIQLIPHTLPSTRLGLDNIQKRYSLLFEKTVTIEKEEGEFVVKLPLVDI